MMFAYLEGQIAVKLTDAVILDVGGVGYHISAAPGMMDRFRKAGERQRIHTHLSVREDGVTLFGFPSREELSLFEMLITVSGVGPRVACSIVADVTPGDFAMAVVTDDPAVLTRAKGVGKKGAQRIILELKDKVGREFGAMSVPIAAGTADSAGGVRADAVSALMVLGYPAAQATRAVDQSYDGQAGLEDTIKAALKQLMR
ncbi:MAG: Holliday junction branch migration protein RuvA [Clostridia bacterium]|nr:Holliday junction branch migration protein RuvA [Clostridia bacterium]